jgi:uroporphyrinogen-III synthase
MRVLITRPRSDSEILAAELAEAGVDSFVGPLLDIVVTPGNNLDLAGVQALLMTSANGVKAFCHRSDDRALPVYAVGDASARTANDCGFNTVFSASGDVDALAELVEQKVDPSNGTLLHCAGTEIAGDLAAMLGSKHYAYRREVLYKAVVADHFDDDIVSGFKDGGIDGVLLYSPRTAAIFADLIGALDLRSVTAYCLSDNVDKKIDHLEWKQRWIAEVPKGEKLVAAVIAASRP